MAKSGRKRKARVVKVVKSGVPEIYPDVRIHDTTLDHIREKHPREFARIEEVYQTIRSPSRVHESRTDPDSVTLLNDSVTNSSGDPLRVPVAVVGSKKRIAFMKTAYFSSSRNQGKLLWPISTTDVQETED